jgi:hypothetical protein
MPIAAENFDPKKFLGTWHIVVTNYGFWKTRHNPTVTYEELPSPHGRRWRDTLRFTHKSWGKERAGKMPGVDHEQSPGRFIWRGDGFLSLIRSPWWVMMQADDWAVTYFARSNIGTAPGVDLYGRTADLAPTRVAEVLQKIRHHPFLKPHCANLYVPEQTGLSPLRYGDPNTSGTGSTYPSV